MLGVGSPIILPRGADPNALPPPPDDFDIGLPVVSPPVGKSASKAAAPVHADLPSAAKPLPPFPPAARPAVAQRPAPPAPAAAPSTANDDDLADFGDLPLPVISASPKEAALKDLPATRASKTAPFPNLPAKAPASPADFGDLPSPIGSPTDFGDLPSPVASPAGFGDLPSPVASPAGFGDLPSPVASPAGFGDLPSPVASPAGFGDLPSPVIDLSRPDAGLPVVSTDQNRPARQITGAALGFGGPDLPSPRTSVSNEAGFGDGFGELDLPLAATVGLPTVASSQAELPSPSDLFGNLPSTADPNAIFPTPLGLNQQLPSRQGTPSNASVDDLFGPTPPSPGGLFPDGMPPAPPPSQAPTGLGSFPPIGTGGLSSPPDGAISGQAAGSLASQADAFGSLPPAAPAGQATIQRQAGGGVAFGEVNLTDDGQGASATTGSLAPGAGTSSYGERSLGGGDEDMEFGAIPQEDGEDKSIDAAPTALPTKAEVGVVALAPRKSKALKIILAAILVGLTGGIAMSATPLGAFGTHFLSDMLNSGRNTAMLDETVQKSRTALSIDTADQAQACIEQTDEAVNRAPRMASLSAYAAFIGFQWELRFGSDSAVHAHATALLARAIEIDKEAQHLELARAAQASSEGEIAKARQAIQELVRLDSNNIDAAVLEGELELRAKEFNNALVAWQRAAGLEKSARTSFGQARALVGLGEIDKARALAQEALQQAPQHVGARILIAELDIKAGQEEKAATALSQIVGPKADPAIHKAASRAELVSIHTLNGQVHLARSRMSAAEEAFAEALKLDPKDANALCGFGEVLYREGRFAEALARFEAGMQADAENVAARIGAAKARIALERLQEAKDILRKLRETRPSDPVVAYWLAKAEEALGNKPEVEKILTDAIGRDPKGVDAINLYIALAQFLAAQGRTQEADEKLIEARRKLPDSAAIHKALGTVALAAGRLNEAKSEFELALQQDSSDLSSLFSLAVSLRRMGRFDEAQEKFNSISTIDKNYPGLALERGVLFEASGQAQRALEMYQEALSKAPNDPDLMLRVGSAEVASGHATQAEDILRKVLRARPNSAEANHYLGRAQLLKGTNLAEALRFLRRAAEIDPNRAEYWLYIGWAANEAGQPGTAEKALEKALELDQSLADAYWQRGVLLRRQGTIKDAERDLLKALELKPSRFEAYATLAECYEDQSKWGPANTAWRKAIEADSNRPFWRYKLGRLLYNAHDRGGAAEQLKSAVQLAAKETRPAWLWEAYLMLADVSKTAGRRAEAIEYYQEFLKLAPPDSPFRADAAKQLAALGASADGR